MIVPILHSIQEVSIQYATGDLPILVLCSDKQQYVCKYARPSITIAYKLTAELIGSQMALAWNLKTPAVFIYSESDQTVFPPNIKKVVQENPKYLNRIVTIGTHRVAKDKYNKIREVLEDVLHA